MLFPKLNSQPRIWQLLESRTNAKRLWSGIQKLENHSTTPSCGKTLVQIELCASLKKLVQGTKFDKEPGCHLPPIFRPARFSGFSNRYRVQKLLLNREKLS